MNHRQIISSDNTQQVIDKTLLARQWLNVLASDIPKSPPEFTLRVSAHIPANSPAVQEVFEPAFRRLQVMTNGAIHVEAFWEGSLHPEREGIQALQSGLTDLCPVYSAWDAELFPAAQILSLPFIFDSAEIATAVAEDLYRPYFSKDVEKHHIYMGRMVATSEYNLFSRSPIRSLADIHGQKIACSNGVESDIFAALGAIPVGCSTPEAKKQFADHAVFAVSISDSAAQTVGLYKSAKYRTSANLVRVNLEYGLSHQFWEKLPPSLQIIFNQWLRSLAQAGAQIFYGLAGARACSTFLDHGMEFISLSVDEQLRWREKIKSVENHLLAHLERLGYPAHQMLQDLLARTKHYQTWSANDLMQASIVQPLTNIIPISTNP
jgi:TRAP-type C4-dicarboxylate transport system substrate-binding protein